MKDLLSKADVPPSTSPLHSSLPGKIIYIYIYYTTCGKKGKRRYFLAKGLAFRRI